MQKGVALEYLINLTDKEKYFYMASFDIWQENEAQKVNQMMSQTMGAVQ